MIPKKGTESNRRRQPFQGIEMYHFQRLTVTGWVTEGTAAAAALARDGHTRTPQENEELVKEGKASRCAFITNPPGAEVFIDGNKAGVTPFALVLVKLDKPRVVTFKLAGYKTVEKEYDPDGKLIPVALTLAKENP